MYILHRIFFMKQLFAYFYQRQALAWSAAIVWTLGIFYGCSMPGKELPKLHLFDQFDKVVHFTFFFMFAFLWQTVFAKKYYAVWWSIGIAFLYGVGIEIYQKYCVVGRSFDVWDICADTVGALCILFVLKNKK